MMRIALMTLGIAAVAAPTSSAAQTFPIGSLNSLDSLALVVRVQSGAAPLGVSSQAVQREANQILSEAGVKVIAEGPPYLHVNLSHGVVDCRDPASPVRPVRWIINAQVSQSKERGDVIWSDSVRRESAANSLRNDVLDGLRQVLFGLLSRR